jgi:hypothetical protein
MYRVTLSLFCLLIGLSVPAAAGTISSMPEMKEIVDYLGFGEEEVQKLLSGKIEVISKDRKEGTEKELAVALGVIVPAPVPEVARFIRGSKLFDLDKEVISVRDLGDKPPDKKVFSGMKFESNEVTEIAELLKIKPGSTFNFSQAEIGRLKEVADRLLKVGTEKDPTVQEAVNVEHSSILIDRYLAYRKKGLSGIPPYVRGGGKVADPAKELVGVVERSTLIKKAVPDFYRAFRNYPKDTAENVENHFLLMKLMAENRPTFVLAHRMYRIGNKDAILTEKQFYVGHSYNSLKIAAALLTVEKGTLLLYENRTSTDQVAGFGGSVKRGIGRKMMLDKLVTFFKEIRGSIKK